MQNFAGTYPIAAAPNNDTRQLIAADIRSLIAQIEASMRLLETAITMEGGSDEAGSIDIFVLDDVTPRYATTSAALSTCKNRLEAALESLSDSGESDEIPDAGRRPWLIA